MGLPGIVILRCDMRLVRCPQICAVHRPRANRGYTHVMIKRLTFACVLLAAVAAGATLSMPTARAQEKGLVPR